MNVIDMLSVFYAVTEIIADNSQDFFSNVNGVNLLRYFRFLRILLVLRILRLCIKLEYMSFILNVIQKSISDFIVIIGIFFLVITFYALIGRTLLNPYYINNPAKYFETFGDSFMTIFRLITMDNWYVIMTEGVVDSGSLLLISGIVVSIIFIGNFIFLNLFLTVLLDAFEKEMQKLQLELEKKEEIEEPIMEDPKTQLQEFLRINMDESPRGKRQAVKEIQDQHVIEHISNMMSPAEKERNNSFLTNLFQDFNNSKSLLIFAESDVIREICIKIKEHPLFRRICQFFIIMQIVLTTAESFQNGPSYFSNLFYFIIYGFFVTEAICRIIASGLILESEAYLRSYGNIINFGAVFGFYSKLLYYGSNPTFNMAFSIIQTFVPLRILETSKNLRKIILSFRQSLEEIANIVIALMVVW